MPYELYIRSYEFIHSFIYLFEYQLHKQERNKNKLKTNIELSTDTWRFIFGIQMSCR